MNWKLSAVAVLLGLVSMSMLVGCEANKKPDAPAPNTTN